VEDEDLPGNKKLDINIVRTSYLDDSQSNEPEDDNPKKDRINPLLEEDEDFPI